MRIIVLSLAFVLAGCAGITADAELSYDGSQNGDHSDKTECDAEGTVAGEGKITDGRLELTVEDGDGDPMLTRTYEGTFELEETRLDGDAGTWVLRAERTGDDVFGGDEFNGRYEFYLDCEPL